MERKMARETLIEFLEANNNQATLESVEKRLSEHGLGFGVEPIDVIHAAVRDGRVDYNPKTQIITLKEKPKSPSILNSIYDCYD